MDLEEFVNFYSLGSYLGVGRAQENSKEQGKCLLNRFGVIPTRDTSLNCPECTLKLATVGDRYRRGFRFLCENHERQKDI